MEEITIWHNPRCSKSRNALNLLDDKKIKTKIVKYLEEVPTVDEIKKVLTLLNINAKELIRENESLFKELELNKINDEDELINIMNKHPKLIQRPIIIKDGKAVIARPIENLENLL